MTLATSLSPLTGLVWVFAWSAWILGVVLVCALALAVRHWHRRRTGVFAQVLRHDPRSGLLRVLAVSDLLVDTNLREEMERYSVKDLVIMSGVRSSTKEAWADVERTADDTLGTTELSGESNIRDAKRIAKVRAWTRLITSATATLAICISATWGVIHASGSSASRTADVAILVSASIALVAVYSTLVSARDRSGGYSAGGSTTPSGDSTSEDGSSAPGNTEL